MFPAALITSCVISGVPDLSQFGLGIGWVGWKNFASGRATSPSGCRDSCCLQMSMLEHFTSCVISGCDLSQFGLGIGWVGWKNFAQFSFGCPIVT